MPHGRVRIVTSDVASSPQVAAFANLTASDDSTCGVQSLFIGKPSAYFSVDAPYEDVAVAMGLIPLASTVAEVGAFAAKAEAEGWHVGLERLAAAGIPADAAQRMADAITEQRTPPAVHVRAMKADDGSAMEELQAESRPNHHPSCTGCILE